MHGNNRVSFDFLSIGGVRSVLNSAKDEDPPRWVLLVWVALMAAICLLPSEVAAQSALGEPPKANFWVEELPDGAVKELPRGVGPDGRCKHAYVYDKEGGTKTTYAKDPHVNHGSSLENLPIDFLPIPCYILKPGWKGPCPICSPGKAGQKPSTAPGRVQPRAKPVRQGTRPTQRQPVHSPSTQRRPPQSKPTGPYVDPEPLPEEDDMATQLVTGLGVLGGTGVGLYVMLQALGLVTAQTATGGAATAGAAAASKAVTGGTTVTGAGGGAGSGGSGAAAPARPSPGDSRSYQDESGHTWVEVFDGNRWIDSASHAKSSAQAADNQAWQNEQFRRQSEGDTAFDRHLDDVAQDFQKRRKQIHEDNFNLRRNAAEAEHSLAKSIKQDTDVALDRAEATVKNLELTQSVCTVVLMPIIGVGTGSAGTVIGGTSTYASEILGGAATGYVEGGSAGAAVMGAAKGAGTATVQVLVSEGLNSVGAVVLTKFKSLGAQTLGRLTGRAPIAVTHQETGAATALRKIWGNAKAGRSLTSGLLSPDPTPVTKVAASAGEHFVRQVGNAVVNTATAGKNVIKAAYVDPMASKAANEAIFGS